MKSTIVNPSIAPYAGSVPYMRVAEALLAVRNALVRTWREVMAPPRPAWLIVAVRERREGNRLSLRYALPPNP